MQHQYLCVQTIPTQNVIIMTFRPIAHRFSSHVLREMTRAHSLRTQFQSTVKLSLLLTMQKNSSWRVSLRGNLAHVVDSRRAAFPNPYPSLHLPIVSCHGKMMMVEAFHWVERTVAICESAGSKKENLFEPRGKQILHRLDV